MSMLLKILKEEKDNIDYSKLINYEELENIINSIEISKLYKSKFHGLYHSEKVTFFAYLIAKYLKLNEEDMEILFDASKYHDIGRTHDEEDKFHGYASTLKLNFLENKEIYENKENILLLKAIIVGHSNDDSKKNKIFNNYGININNYSRFNLLYNILKDADALDRLRFDKSAIYTLDEKYLRIDISKNIINIAKLVNEKYHNK